MKNVVSTSKNILFSVSNLEKKHKVITYASLLFLTLSTYFLRTDNQKRKESFAIVEQRTKRLNDDMIIFNRGYDNFPLPIWQKVKRGNKFIIEFVNKKFIDDYGGVFDYNKYSFIGKSNFDLYPKKIAQKVYEDDLAIAISGKIFKKKQKLTSKDGKPLNVEIVKWRDIVDHKDTLIYSIIKTKSIIKNKLNKEESINLQ